MRWDTMAKVKKMWIFSPPKQAKPKVPDAVKPMWQWRRTTSLIPSWSRHTSNPLPETSVLTISLSFIRAGIVGNLNDYPWSRQKGYISKAKEIPESRRLCPEIIDIKEAVCNHYKYSSGWSIKVQKGCRERSSWFCHLYVYVEVFTRGAVNNRAGI